EIHPARGGDPEPEGGEVEVQVAQVGGGAVQEDEPIVRDLRQRGGQLAGAIEDAAQEARAEARAVAQRRVAERRVEQVVQALEASRDRKLGAAIDQLLEHLLLGVRVDPLAGRVAELRFRPSAESGAMGRSPPKVRETLAALVPSTSASSDCETPSRCAARTSALATTASARGLRCSSLAGMALLSIAIICGRSSHCKDGQN